MHHEDGGTVGFPDRVARAHDRAHVLGAVLVTRAVAVQRVDYRQRDGANGLGLESVAHRFEKAVHFPGLVYGETLRDEGDSDAPAPSVDLFPSSQAASQARSTLRIDVEHVASFHRAPLPLEAE